MEREIFIYLLYILFFLVLVVPIFVVPVLAFDNDVEAVYKAFSYLCHQKISRSYCIFSDGGGYWIGDCTPQTGEYITGDRRQIAIEQNGAIGYKMPLCSRDVGLYGALLFGGLVYPLARELKDKTLLPPLYLILAIVPLGIDGGLQLTSELGLLPFIYESTNLIRLITGIIAGMAASFYAIPTLMNMFRK